MSFKIYTRKGDDGKTGLIGGDRVAKHHIRVESYGTVDELNSQIGLVRSFISGSAEEDHLANIQNNLFTIGSYLASSPSSKFELPKFDESSIPAMEEEIDRLTALLPELKNFILPGATQQGSHCHVARCVCRRAERLIVHLSDIEEIQPFIIQYLNRLSDYLFTLSRFLDQKFGGKEIIWRP
ncbi:MAG: cob(I)yrinic acid a,c-diamide adenosyltransferase [Bacteroidia bacterium]|nr:cob(I)yrinic acid a,c-diamide adenosyltransferase [Bacteroidia bacterium]